ncbi:coniferyl-aldehyde dehydrogenase [Dokdonella fugitiva]|uniref:Aldehyde dehydrogenase n=1 Tax=Dokdonella fugitiva TaxID=328517 RepID=A0A839EUB5_9GAMM|nr:coniferyl aldehyde dehydrogenase [Dokdonella fugitiva]MBA8886203.1 coniferyl-aldehyde dehydrogenase [Dokdonella fugitiva]
MTDGGPFLRDQYTRLRDAQARSGAPDLATRKRRLRALEALIRDHRAQIAEAIAADFGRRPVEETDLLEVFPSLSGIRHALSHLRRWMRPRRRWAGFWFLPARTELRPQPLGVVGIIVPWNYPLYLAAGPLTDALAAGNRVMLKTSELTPAFATLLSELVARHFLPDEVVVVNGDVDVARAFSALPFDHLLFTGSTAVGHEVMRAAAANLVPVTLELGGKSPAIVGPNARMPHAIERIVLGKLLNAGQTCIAPDYVLLPRARVQEFIDGARAAVGRLYPQLAANAQYTSIASERHHARLCELRDAAVEQGAVVHELAEVPANARVIAPTLLTGVDDRMGVMQQEIFGPLLPLVPYDSIDDAIAYVNAHPHPLALYVFDDRRAVVERVLDATLAGGVSVNDTILHIAQHHLPFGGVGASGMGAYHGEDGFRTFSRMKPVFRQARWNLVGLLNPPYRTTFRRMLRMLLGG